MRDQPMKTIIIAAMSAILATAAVEAQSPTQKRERAVAVPKNLQTGDAKAWSRTLVLKNASSTTSPFPTGAKWSWEHY